MAQGFVAAGRTARMAVQVPHPMVGRPVSGEGAAALWARASEALRERMGAGSHRSWIAPLRLERVERGVATLAVPTAFMGSYVERTFGDAILAALARAGAPAGRLHFAASAAEALPDEPEAPRAPAATPAVPAAPEDSGSRLDPRLSFETFVTGPSNAIAHGAARRVAAGEAAFNPLFLHGGVGLGKTHLLQAIAGEVRATDPTARVLYLSAEQFMYRFVGAIRERRTMDFKALFRAVDILLVDDVQFIAGKDSTQEEFFHTFNALMDAGKRIVLSADRPPSEIAGLDERVASRLQSGLAVAVEPADAPLRLAILRAKAARACAAEAGLRVDDAVLEFLAARITSNVRVLEGALTRLIAQASLTGREVTVEMARASLSDVLRAADKRVSIEEIQRRVADHYAIRVADIVGQRRLRTFARPRQVAMWLSKAMTSRSLPDIGRRFGNRDHTTVLHGVRRIEALRVEDAQLAQDLDRLRRAIEA